MTAVATAFPILPGKLEAFRRFVQEMQGSRRQEYQESRRRLGITREAAWHQHTPQGDLAIVYTEADDPTTIAEGLAHSSAPFDIWFREQVLDIHGVDFAHVTSGALPQLVFSGPD